MQYKLSVFWSCVSLGAALDILSIDGNHNSTDVLVGDLSHLATTVGGCLVAARVLVVEPADPDVPIPVVLEPDRQFSYSVFPLRSSISVASFASLVSSTSTMISSSSTMISSSSTMISSMSTMVSMTSMALVSSTPLIPAAILQATWSIEATIHSAVAQLPIEEISADWRNTGVAPVDEDVDCDVKSHHDVCWVFLVAIVGVVSQHAVEEAVEDTQGVSPSSSEELVLVCHLKAKYFNNCFYSKLKN